MRRKLGESPLVDKDYAAFTGYQLSSELAFLILEQPLLMPRQLLLNGLRHLRDEVKSACREAIALRVKQGEWDWISILRKSTSLATGTRKVLRQQTTHYQLQTALFPLRTIPVQLPYNTLFALSLFSSIHYTPYYKKRGEGVLYD